jgi:two-component system response regulator AlgR
MTPRILIVDDEAPARVRLTNLLSDIVDECPHVLVGEAASADAALAAVAMLQPDIVLLDVQMPGASGLELAAQFAQQVDRAPLVIFITAYENFAVRAFEVQAIDYLLKPVRATRLAQALGRAVRKLAMVATPSAARSSFAVQVRERVLLVPLDEVLYLKAESKYVTVRTLDHAYLIEESLLSLEQELNASFLRVHRNALVARTAIAGVERASVAHVADNGERALETWRIIVRGIDERLPVSRRQWPVIKALLK